MLPVTPRTVNEKWEARRPIFDNAATTFDVVANRVEVRVVAALAPEKGTDLPFRSSLGGKPGVDDSLPLLCVLSR
jgi:hypothetical protein